MARVLPKPALEAAVSAVRGHPEGATFIPIASAMTPLPPMRNLQRWLAALVGAGRLIRVGRVNSVRNEWVDSDTAGPRPGVRIPFPAATAVTQALQLLVSQPFPPTIARELPSRLA